MRYSKAKEVRVWWPLPLAALLWLLIIWGFGFFLTSPEVKPVTSPPIEASFVELPEEKVEQKAAPIPQPAPKPPPRPRPQPRLGAEKAKPAERQPEKEAPKKASREDQTPAPKPEPPKDLAEYMKEAKERRTAGGIFEDEPSAPKNMEPEPSEEDLRMANVRRNLREPGTSGIFQITRMGPRTAEFLFRAWRTDVSNPRREVVEVHAGPDGDIHRAVARKMIELIRQYQKGDFNWESYRLGTVVVLSAREEDSKGLEDFLIREFFDPRYGLR
ncbi:MAG: hypothetical protein ACREUR_07675 [Nitrosospira sp.]